MTSKKIPEESPCKSCGEIFPTDHLKKGYCCFCIEHIPEELLTGKRSSTTNKQPFIPPANWGGKREKMREQEKNLPKDEDSWELQD